MSTPMEVTLPNRSDIAPVPGGAAAAGEGEAVPQSVVAASAAPVAVARSAPVVDKILVPVEVLMNPSSTVRVEDVQTAVERMLENRSMSYSDGPVLVPADDTFLCDNVKRILICDIDEWVGKNDVLLFWQVKPVVHVFQLNEDGPGEEPSEDDTLSSFNEWALPAKEFDGLYESLIYEIGLKQRLLRYAASALLFTERGVNTCLVSWNRMGINLHSQATQA